MTVDEIFNKIAAHMRKGLVIHDQIASIYGFLNLRGYKKCHEYHFLEESMPKLIPSNWLKYTKIEVDINARRNAIKDTMKQWVEWEQEAKKLWEDSYIKLYELGEVYAAQIIQTFLKDTAEELNMAREKQICLESSGYDMPFILEEQKSLYKKYEKKMRCIQ